MYELLASFAQTWGLLLFVALFSGATVYALWPRNQAKFDAAAMAPLTDPDQPDVPEPSAASRAGD